MIGFDTNIVLRFVLKDDPIQTPQARALFASLSPEEPAWVSITTILEIVWVLTNSKNMNREAVSQTIEELLAAEVLSVEQANSVLWAVQHYRASKADFADCLIAASARAAGCTKTMTFDKIAARDVGMTSVGAPGV